MGWRWQGVCELSGQIPIGVGLVEVVEMIVAGSGWRAGAVVTVHVCSFAAVRLSVGEGLVDGHGVSRGRGTGRAARTA
jgi:hypothetical protein